MADTWQDDVIRIPRNVHTDDNIMPSDHSEAEYRTQDMDQEGINTAGSEGSAFHFSYGLPGHWQAAMPELNAFKAEVRFVESIVRRWPQQQAEKVRQEIMKTYMDMLYSKLHLSPPAMFPPPVPPLNPPAMFPPPVPPLNLPDDLSRSAAQAVIDILTDHPPPSVATPLWHRMLPHPHLPPIRTHGSNRGGTGPASQAPRQQDEW